MALATGLMATLVVGSANPVSADQALPWRHFGLWPSNFCASSSGIAGHITGNVYSIAAATASLSAGTDGVCNDHSPAPAGTFSAMPRLQIYFEPTGGWSACVDDDDLRAPNAHGAWYVGSSDTVYGCGAAPHRLWAGSRITYDGVNQYDNRYSGEL